MKKIIFAISLLLLLAALPLASATTEYLSLNPSGTPPPFDSSTSGNLAELNFLANADITLTGIAIFLLENPTNSWSVTITDLSNSTVIFSQSLNGGANHSVSVNLLSGRNYRFSIPNMAGTPCNIGGAPTITSAYLDFVSVTSDACSGGEGYSTILDGLYYELTPAPGVCQNNYNGENILTENCSATATIYVNANSVLDCNGYSLSGNVGNNEFLVLQANATLSNCEIKDVYANPGNGRRVILLSDGASILNNITIHNATAAKIIDTYNIFNVDEPIVINNLELYDVSTSDNYIQITHNTTMNNFEAYDINPPDNQNRRLLFIYDDSSTAGGKLTLNNAYIHDIYWDANDGMIYLSSNDGRVSLNINNLTTNNINTSTYFNTVLMQLSSNNNVNKNSVIINGWTANNIRGRVIDSYGTPSYGIVLDNLQWSNVDGIPGDTRNWDKNSWYSISINTPFGGSPRIITLTNSYLNVPGILLQASNGWPGDPLQSIIENVTLVQTESQTPNNDYWLVRQNPVAGEGSLFTNVALYLANNTNKLRKSDVACQTYNTNMFGVKTSINAQSGGEITIAGPNACADGTLRDNNLFGIVDLGLNGYYGNNYTARNNIIAGQLSPGGSAGTNMWIYNNTINCINSDSIARIQYGPHWYNPGLVQLEIYNNSLDGSCVENSIGGGNWATWVPASEIRVNVHDNNYGNGPISQLWTYGDKVYVNYTNNVFNADIVVIIGGKNVGGDVVWNLQGNNFNSDRLISGQGNGTGGESPTINFLGNTYKPNQRVSLTPTTTGGTEYPNLYIEYYKTLITEPLNATGNDLYVDCDNALVVTASPVCTRSANYVGSNTTIITGTFTDNRENRVITFQSVGFSSCVPNWLCTGFSACGNNNIQACNAITDLNSCVNAFNPGASFYNLQCVAPVTNATVANNSQPIIIESASASDPGSLVNDTNKFPSITVNPQNVTDLVISSPAVQVSVSFAGESINTTAINTSGISSTTEIIANVLIQTFSINSTITPELNRPATLTFSNINSDFRILRNGETCSFFYCQNIQYNYQAKTLTFDVPSWSGYSVETSIAVAEGCQDVRSLVFAGLGLLAVIIIVTAAFLLIKFGNDFDIITMVAISSIGFAIVLFVGYVVVSLVQNAICSV